MDRERPITVVVVDDHDVFRRGLVRLLSDEPDIEVIGEAPDGELAVRVATQLLPDVVIMDLNLPEMNGIEATRRLVARAPQVRVMVLTISIDEHDVVEAILAGARGYLVKDSSIEEIIRGVRSAAAGESLISPRIATMLLERLREHAAPAYTRDGGELTARELEILRLVAAGLDNLDIARELVISPQTVKSHVSNILAKLQLDNRIQAAVHAVRHGLV